MNKKTSALLVGAMISGLVAGNAAYAKTKDAKKANTAEAPSADHKCKGEEKCTPEAKEKKAAEAAKHQEGADHACKDGSCGGKDKKKK